MKDNWKGRTTGMVCGTCVFFVEKESTVVQRKDHFVGRCRYNAPTMKGFPVVFSTDWCGQHKLDENKIDLLEKKVTNMKFATDK